MTLRQIHHCTYQGAVKNTITGFGNDSDSAASSNSSADDIILPPDFATICSAVSCRSAPPFCRMSAQVLRIVNAAGDRTWNDSDTENTFVKVNREKTAVLDSH